MKKTFLAFVLSGFCLNAYCLDGGGSTSFSEAVMPLLAPNPALKKFVLCNFEIVSDAEGVRLGNNVAPKLGGSVIGPYSMWVNWHGSAGLVRAVLVVNTNIKFFNSHGKEIKNGDLRGAVKYVEEFEGINIKSPDKDQPTSVPDGLKYDVDREMCKEDAHD